MAVITPIGNSAGATIVLERQSETTKKTPPNKNENNASFFDSTPTIILPI